jgi:hypothetical protein
VTIIKQILVLLLGKSFPVSAQCGTGYASISVCIALLLGVLMVQIRIVVYAHTFHVRGGQPLVDWMYGGIL